MLLMFEVEKAFWFYQDFCREDDPTLPSLSMGLFTTHIFAVSALLSHLAGSVDSIVAKWQVKFCASAPHACSFLGGLLLVRFALLQLLK
jgi:hypothetical protein